MNSKDSKRKYRTKTEKYLGLRLSILEYQLNQLKQQSISESQQTKKLLERKPQPLLLGK